VHRIGIAYRYMERRLIILVCSPWAPLPLFKKQLKHTLVSNPFVNEFAKTDCAGIYLIEQKGRYLIRYLFTSRGG